MFDGGVGIQIWGRMGEGTGKPLWYIGEQKQSNTNC